MSNREFVLTLGLIFAGFFLIGCASQREREAFSDFEASGAAFYTGPGAKNTESGETTSVPGLPKLNSKSTLSDYLAYAALNNPGLEAAFNRWKAALERIPQVRTLPDPRFSYGYFIRKVETRTGPQRQKFAMSQTFPWFGKLALRGDVATENANAARQHFESAKLRLFYRVRNAYYEYYYLARAIDITRDNMKLLSYLERVARTRYQAGAANHSDVIRAQVELGKLEDRLRSLQDIRSPIVARLNAALNRKPDAPLPWPKHISAEKVTFSDRQLLSWLAESNPELKAIDHLAAREKNAIALAKKNFYPDLTLKLEYIDTDEAINRNTRDSGKDPVVAMFTVNLPIWYAKNRASVREARARYRANLKKRRDRENNLSAELKMALYAYRDAERKIDLYKNSLIPKAKQSLNVTQQGFLTAKVGFLDLIDAQRTLLEFQLSYERAFANRAQRLAELEMLIGREIPGTVTWNNHERKTK